MKPSRSLVYCREARRQKTLFESESKANNFIKFNADEIRESSGFAPVRSYYCISCGGWHVTHLPEFRQGKTVSEIMTDKLNDDLENRKKARMAASQQNKEIKRRNAIIIDNIKSSFETIRGFAASGDKDKAEATLLEAYRELQSIWDSNGNKKAKRILHRGLDNIALGMGMRPVKIRE